MLHRYELETQTGLSLGTMEFAVSDWKPGDLITIAKNSQYRVLSVQEGRLVVEDLGDARGVVAQ